MAVRPARSAPHLAPSCNAQEELWWQRVQRSSAAPAAASSKPVVTLDEIERTGKLGSTHGVGAAEIASQVVGWCAAQALALAEASLAPEIVQSASISARTRMALRVAHNERANLIQWMAALREKHALPEALIEEATAKHKACLKKLKQAIKQASQGEAHALEREREAAAAVDVD